MRDRLDRPYSVTVRAVREGKIAPFTLPDHSKVIQLQLASTDELSSASSS